MRVRGTCTPRAKRGKGARHGGCEAAHGSTCLWWGVFEHALEPGRHVHGGKQVCRCFHKHNGARDLNPASAHAVLATRTEPDYTRKGGRQDHGATNLAKTAPAPPHYHTHTHTPHPTHRPLALADSPPTPLHDVPTTHVRKPEPPRLRRDREQVVNEARRPVPVRLREACADGAPARACRRRRRKRWQRSPSSRKRHPRVGDQHPMPLMWPVPPVPEEIRHATATGGRIIPLRGTWVPLPGVCTDTPPTARRGAAHRHRSPLRPRSIELRSVNSFIVSPKLVITPAAPHSGSGDCGDATRRDGQDSRACAAVNERRAALRNEAKHRQPRASARVWKLLSYAHKDGRALHPDSARPSH